VAHLKWLLAKRCTNSDKQRLARIGSKYDDTLYPGGSGNYVPMTNITQDCEDRIKDDLTLTGDWKKYSSVRLFTSNPNPDDSIGICFKKNDGGADKITFAASSDLSKLLVRRFKELTPVDIPLADLDDLDIILVFGLLSDDKLWVELVLEAEGLSTGSDLDDILRDGIRDEESVFRNFGRRSASLEIEAAERDEAAAEAEAADQAEAEGIVDERTEESDEERDSESPIER